jgi:HK97 family phage prohead protease
MTDLALPELEVVRTTLTVCELRSDADEVDDSLGLMDVRFSPFNTWYEIDSFWEGRFLERTVPGAFKRTINQHNDKNSSHSMKTLFNHGMDFNIGDKLLGDIVELAEDKDSPRSTVRLWDTSYNRDLLPGLRSGAYGSSFMFRVRKEEWEEPTEATEHNPDKLPERTVKEAHSLEAGPVTWPASPTATAGMRSASATDQYYERLAQRDPDRVEELRSRITALRDAGRLAPGARLLPALAQLQADDSADGRSTGLTHAQKRRRYFDMARSQA